MVNKWIKGNKAFVWQKDKEKKRKNCRIIYAEFFVSGL